MGGVPLQLRHLLLLVAFLPFFDEVKARFEALSSFAFLCGDSPFEKPRGARVDPNICRVYKYLSLFSGPQNYLEGCGFCSPSLL